MPKRIGIGSAARAVPDMARHAKTAIAVAHDVLLSGMRSAPPLCGAEPSWHADGTNDRRSRSLPTGRKPGDVARIASESALKRRMALDAGGDHEIPDRRTIAHPAAGRNRLLPVAGPDPDRVERRVSAGGADRGAAPGRGAAQGAERRAGQAAGIVAPALLSDRRRDGRFLCRNEPGVRATVRGEPRRGGDA